MNKRSLLVLVLSLVMILALTPVTSAFSDTKGSKGEKHIHHLKQRGVIKGDSKGKDKFNPNQQLSYAQAAVLLDDSFNLSVPTDVKMPKVSDVYAKAKDNAWYAQAFLDTYYNGIVFDKHINPNAAISREEFAALLIQQLNRTIDYSIIEIYINYKDEDKVNENYKGEIQTLLILKIEELEKDNKFHPQKAITREDAAIWLSNVLSFIDEQKKEQEPVSALSDIDFTLTKINDEVNRVTISATVPHPGYGFNIEGITFSGNIATITIAQTNPDPDKLYPQVISTAKTETFVDKKYKVKVVVKK